MKNIFHFVDGKEFKGDSKRTSDVFNPATGEVQAKVSLASKNDVDVAVKNANEAFKEWSLTPPITRARILFKYKELIEKNSDELTKLIVAEHGKVYDDAKGSLTRGLEVVEFACGIPHLLKGEFTENVGKGVDSWSMRQPLGVCAGITPFNFPAMVPMWMFPMAIACGNAFMLKPSEKVPQCSLKLGELLHEAGLPENVLTIINGDKRVVDNILQSPDIASVSFVGSTSVAKYIYTECAKYNKRVQALGGAKNHMLIMEDANLEDAVNGLIGAAFGSAGERCMATSVALRIGKIQKPFMELLKEKVSQIKVGESLDPQSEMGPLITKEHQQKVLNYIEKGISEGATLEMDGRNLNLQGFENGNFVGPTIFNNVSTDMTIYREEIFGPVLSVIILNHFNVALKIINIIDLGNGTSIILRTELL